MIRQTLFAVADSNAKPIHQGSLFKIENRTLDVVSVDGYRLALRREAIPFDGSLEFVVPGKTLGEVLKLLRDDDGEIEICPSRRHILFKIDNYTVLSALLEGEFLDYRAALPKDKKTEAVVSTRTLIESVERVSLLITDRLKSPVRCVLSEDTIKLLCSTTMGRANDQIEAKISGDPLEIGFNNKYLPDQPDAHPAEGGRCVFVPRSAGAPAQRNLKNVSRDVFRGRTLRETQQIKYNRGRIP